MNLQWEIKMNKIIQKEIERQKDFKKILEKNPYFRKESKFYIKLHKQSLINFRDYLFELSKELSKGSNYNLSTEILKLFKPYMDILTDIKELNKLIKNYE